MAQEQNPLEIVRTKQTVKVPIPFFANLPANTNLTVCANPISVNYKVVNVEAHFRDDTANNLRMYFFVSNNRNLSTTTPPPDDNVVSSLSPTPYLQGSGEIISLPCEYTPAPNFMYVKVYFENLNAYAITGFAVVTIEALLNMQKPLDINSPEFTQAAQQASLELQAKTKASLDLVTDSLAGSLDYIAYNEENVKKIQGIQTEDVKQKGSELELIKNWVSPSMTDEEIASSYRDWFHKIQIFQAQQQTGLAIEGLVGSILPSGISIYGTSVDYYNQTFPTTQFVGGINKFVYEVAWGEALKRVTLNEWLPYIPEPAELINEVVKEVIPYEGFEAVMRQKGFSPAWSKNIWDAHYIQPAFGEIQRAAWKGTIKHDEIERYLKLVDLDPRYNDSVWKALLENVPTIQDSINMLTKEVITQEQFNTLLNNNGYSTYWGKRYWDAHFTPATYIDFLTAMRRKDTVNIPHADGTITQHKFGDNPQSDLDIIHDLGKLADYDPRYQSFFDTRMFNDPTPRMAQWAFEASAIDEPTLREVVHRFGYTADTEKWYGDMLIHFRERAWINKYLTKLQTAYTSKALPIEEIRKQVKTITNSENIAKWIQMLGDLDGLIAATGTKASENALISMGELKKMYVLDIIDSDKFLYEMRAKNFIESDIQLLKELLDREKEATKAGGMKQGLTVAELFDAYKYSEITEDTLRTELLLRNMTLLDANILINSKKKKWGVETA